MGMLFSGTRKPETVTRSFITPPSIAYPAPEPTTSATPIHPVKSHIVIYRIEPSRDILIMRVRHGHEDPAIPVNFHQPEVGRC